MNDRKFGIWDFDAKNSEKVALFAQKYVKGGSEPTNPWQILHGIDQHSYKIQFVAKAAPNIDMVIDNEISAAVFRIPEPVDAISERKDVRMDTCSNAPLKQWPELLPSLTEDDACLLLQELCENPSVVLERHALVATHLLLPKLQSGQTISRKLCFAAIKFVANFPAPSICFLLTELIVQAPANEHHLDDVKELANQLGTSALQATLLSSVTSSLERLHKNHLPFLLMLIKEDLDAENTNKLVELMAASAMDLAKEINFGRLIIAVLKLESANYPAMEYIINKHQTPLKGKAAKLLGQRAVN